MYYTIEIISNRHSGKDFWDIMAIFINNMQFSATWRETLIQRTSLNAFTSHTGPLLNTQHSQVAKFPRKLFLDGYSNSRQVETPISLLTFKIMQENTGREFKFPPVSKGLIQDKTFGEILAIKARFIVIS